MEMLFRPLQSRRWRPLQSGRWACLEWTQRAAPVSPLEWTRPGDSPCPLWRGHVDASSTDRPCPRAAHRQMYQSPTASPLGMLLGGSDGERKVDEPPSEHRTPKGTTVRLGAEGRDGRTQCAD